MPLCLPPFHLLPFLFIELLCYLCELVRGARHWVYRQNKFTTVFPRCWCYPETQRQVQTTLAFPAITPPTQQIKINSESFRSFNLIHWSTDRSTWTLARQYRFPNSLIGQNGHGAKQSVLETTILSRSLPKNLVPAPPANTRKSASLIWSPNLRLCSPTLGTPCT